MEAYELVQSIGQGAYGAVYKCVSRQAQECVAVKAFFQAHEQPEVRRLAIRELHVLRTLPAHANVVRLLDFFRSRSSGRVYLVFDYMERNLLEEAQRHGGAPLPCPALRLVAWQLLLALAHCHEHKVVHRDVKPANVLVSGSGEALHTKLCDFGFARKCTSHNGVQPPTRQRVHAQQAHGQLRGGADDDQMSSYVVTRWYRAPEILVGKQYGTAVDIWSYGCTLAEMVLGRPLFPGTSSLDQLWHYTRCLGPLPATLLAGARMSGTLPVAVPGRHRTLRQRLPPNTDARLLELITCCLALDPKQRPSAKELLQLPYFWDVPRLLSTTGLDVTITKAAASPATKVPATESRTPIGSAAAVTASAVQPAAVAAALGVKTAAPVAAPVTVRAAGAAGAAAPAAAAGTGAGVVKPQDAPAAARVQAARNSVPATATPGTAPITTTIVATFQLAGAASAMPTGLQTTMLPLGATAAAAATMPLPQRPMEAAALVGDAPRGARGSIKRSSRSSVPGTAAATVRWGCGQGPSSTVDTCAAAGSQQAIAVCTPSPEEGCGSRGAIHTSTGLDRKFQHSLSEPGEAGWAHVAIPPGMVEGAVATAAALSGPYTWDAGRYSGDPARLTPSDNQGLNTGGAGVFSQSLQYAVLRQQLQEASGREARGRRGALPPDPMGYGALQYSASVYRQDTIDCTTLHNTGACSQLLSTGDMSQPASLAACEDVAASTPYQESPYGGPNGSSRTGNPFPLQGPATASCSMPRGQLRRPPMRGGSSGYLNNEPRHPHAAALQLRAQLAMRMSVPGSPARVVERSSNGLRSKHPGHLASETAIVGPALAAMQLRLRNQPEGFEPVRTSPAGEQVASGGMRHMSSGPCSSDNASVSVRAQPLGAMAAGHSGGISLGPRASSSTSSRCAPVPSSALRTSLMSGAPSRQPMGTYRHTVYARTQSSGITSRLSSSSLDFSLPSAAGPGLLSGQGSFMNWPQQPRASATGTGMAGDVLPRGMEGAAGAGGPSMSVRDTQHLQQLLVDRSLSAAVTAAAVAAATGSAPQAKDAPGGYVHSLSNAAHVAQVLAAEGGQRCNGPGGTIMEGDEADALRALAAPDAALNATTHTALSHVSGESGSGGLARVHSCDGDDVTHGSARTSAMELGDRGGRGRKKGGGGGVLASPGISERGVGGCSTGAFGSKLRMAFKKGVQKWKGGLAAMLGKKGARGKQQGCF